MTPTDHASDCHSLDPAVCTCDDCWNAGTKPFKCKGCGAEWDSGSHDLVEGFEVLSDNDFEACLNCLEEGGETICEK